MLLSTLVISSFCVGFSVTLLVFLTNNIILVTNVTQQAALFVLVWFYIVKLCQHNLVVNCELPCTITITTWYFLLLKRQAVILICTISF